MTHRIRLSRARRALAEAQEAHNKATASRDTRTMHHTAKRLRQALHAALRAEVRV